MNIFLYTYVIAGLASLILGAIAILSSLVVIPMLIMSKARWFERLASGLLLLAYDLFFADAAICFYAILGTIGDGSTSTHKYVNPDLLFPVGVVQLACFIFWGKIRFQSRSVAVHQNRHMTVTILLLLPGLISIWFVLKTIATSHLGLGLYE